MLVPATMPPLTTDAVASTAVRFEVSSEARAVAAMHDIDVPACLHRAVDKRLSEFVAGRYCAREALRLLGIEGPHAVGMRPDRGPAWPAGIVGSITHTMGVAWAVAASRQAIRGIGIDIETIPEAHAARQVEAVILTTAERDVLLPITQRWGVPTAIGLALSMKESLYKCLAAKAAAPLEFRDASLVGINQRDTSFRIRLNPAVMAAWPDGCEWSGRFAIEPPHVYTVIEQRVEPDREE
ncbi:MAG: 4'-phosphopantetheinyl transferase superfamily protein [Verrucomicrobia bacterium]|jgi:enterobactin synthetase component D|nr:4'-phosphopantetheinyl transferase superfamily protein [Verrucomicrobiota bacterium]MBT7067418.1 4'-phosphopantetheinyl transferase superfamily protein [Verrucomicrobiota bacterium]MBT7700060.1 4'-phosphopantetheinyl transferase superfamily protein [Verrucomicrobiota bacterium]